MKTFDVYPLMNFQPVKALGSLLWDENNNQYLDLYGGHAVISVGHSHPYYVNTITEQLNNIGFYSNAVQNKLQEELAQKLGQISGYTEYSLFLCNSGAEANENALKLASFHNGKSKVIAFKNSFHGRTSLAVSCTDDVSIQAKINQTHEVVFVPLNDEEAFLESMDHSVAAVIIEGIQGVAGIYSPQQDFLKLLRKCCDEFGAVLIVDEVQSGTGRSGHFFAHQSCDIQADIISVAKGLGNGFPVAAILIHPVFTAKYGMLGTTFGGNHLACAAAIAVLDILKEEQLIDQAKQKGAYWMKKIAEIEGVKVVRGEGLMIGIEFDFAITEIKKSLFEDYQILVGTASNKNVIRLLPALTVSYDEMDLFTSALKEIMVEQLTTKA